MDNGQINMRSGTNHGCLFMDSPTALAKDEILENFYPGYISALDAYIYTFPKKFTKIIFTTQVLKVQQIRTFFQ